MGLINLLAPYRVYLMAFAAGLLVFSGWKVRDWQCDAAYAKALEKADKARGKAQVVIDAGAQKYEQERSKADAVTIERSSTIREIYRDLPAPSVDCAAPDGARRVLEDAVSGANAAATGKSGG